MRNQQEITLNMKCSTIPCDKEGIHCHRVNIGYGMIGEAWFCDEHLPKLDIEEQTEVTSCQKENNHD